MYSGLCIMCEAATQGPGALMTVCELMHASLPYHMTSPTSNDPLSTSFAFRPCHDQRSHPVMSHNGPILSASRRPLSLPFSKPPATTAAARARCLAWPRSLAAAVYAASRRPRSNCVFFFFSVRRVIVVVAVVVAVRAPKSSEDGSDSQSSSQLAPPRTQQSVRLSVSE